MNCAEVVPNLEAYALGALDVETQARVERHLTECDACRRAALQFSIVAHTLPDALAKRSPLVPPASLKQNLMAAVQAEAQAEVKAHTAIQQVTPRKIKPSPAYRGHWLLNPRLWTVSLGVSLIVILALVTWLSVTHNRLEQALSNETAALDQVHSYKISEDARTTLIQFQNPQQVYMQPTDLTSNIKGTLTFDVNKPYIVFQASNLPQPELGKQYYLWTMNEGRMQLVSRFTPKPNGDIQVSFSVDREYPVLKRVILTRQVSLREMADDQFPSNESILEWDSQRSKVEPW